MTRHPVVGGATSSQILPDAAVFTNRRKHASEASSSKVLELYRKRSGETRFEREGIFRAGAFLIQRLEGSGLERDRYAF